MAPLPPLPGREARFVWDGGSVILNDLISQYPRYYVSTMGGWRSTADAELPSEANTGRVGERPRFGLRRGKTITFEGKTEALTLIDLRNAEDALLNAFWDTVTEKRCEVQIRVAGVWTPVYWFMARSISVDGPENQPVGPLRYTRGYERAFIITLRMSDPVFYHVNKVSSMNTLFPPSTSTLVPPFTPPVTLPLPSGGGYVTVDNPGLIAADPLVRVYGPVTNLVVHSETIDRNLSFAGVTVEQDRWLDIDFKSRKVLLESTSDLRRFQDGDWWDRNVPGLVPGNNRIQFSGSGMSFPQTRAEISFYPPRY